MDRLTEKMNNGEYGFKMSGDVYSIHSLATLEVASMNIENNEEAFRTLSAIAERLAAYENLNLSPEQLKEFDSLYLERCNEINRLNAELAEYKNLEEKGLLLKLPYLQGNYVFHSLNGKIKMSGYSNPVAAEMIYRDLLKEEDGQALERMSE